jgi:hypothetical protein
MTIILWVNILKAQQKIPAKMVVQMQAKKRKILVILMKFMRMILQIHSTKIFKTAFSKKI